jgi:hypothetical protein
MERIFFYAIMLYALFLALYLLRERMRKRKKNAARKSVFNPFKSPPEENIIGKSTFSLPAPGHSRTEATTLITSEKRLENTPTFAGGNEKLTPAADPADESLDSEIEGENSDNEIDINVEDYTPRKDSLEVEDDEPEEEGEDDEPDGEAVAGVSMARGVSFDELEDTLQTVDKPEAATTAEREEAGRVLTEVRETELMTGIVSDEPQKQSIVTGLMDDYFAAFRRKKREAGEVDEPTIPAPKGFDIRGFA